MTTRQQQAEKTSLRENYRCDGVVTCLGLATTVVFVAVVIVSVVVFAVCSVSLIFTSPDAVKTMGDESICNLVAMTLSDGDMIESMTGFTLIYENHCYLHDQPDNITLVACKLEVGHRLTIHYRCPYETLVDMFSISLAATIIVSVVGCVIFLIDRLHKIKTMEDRAIQAKSM